MSKDNKTGQKNVFEGVTFFDFALGEVDLDQEDKKPQKAKIRKNKDRRGRPKKNNLVRTKGAQQGLPKNEIRKTYIMDVSLVERIENLADKHDMTIKDTMNSLLEEALEDKGV